jgi:hypothetical protein
VLEAGTAQLFAANRGVIAGTQEEDLRVALLYQVKEKFLSRFKQLGLGAGFDEASLVDFVVERLKEYDSSLKAGPPEQQNEFIWRVFENVSGGVECSPLDRIIAGATLEYANNSAKFVKELNDIIFAGPAKAKVDLGGERK